MKVAIMVKVKIDDIEKEMTIDEAKQLRDALNSLLGDNTYPNITLPSTPSYPSNPTFPWADSNIRWFIS